VPYILYLKEQRPKQKDKRYDTKRFKKLKYIQDQNGHLLTSNVHGLPELEDGTEKTAKKKNTYKHP
jgi:hypothetical protein